MYRLKWNRSEDRVGYLYPPRPSDAICERIHYACNPPHEAMRERRSGNDAATVTITQKRTQEEREADRLSHL